AQSTLVAVAASKPSRTPLRELVGPLALVVDRLHVSTACGCAGVAGSYSLLELLDPNLKLDLGSPGQDIDKALVVVFVLILDDERMYRSHRGVARRVVCPPRLCHCEQGALKRYAVVTVIGTTEVAVAVDVALVPLFPGKPVPDGFHDVFEVQDRLVPGHDIGPKQVVRSKLSALSLKFSEQTCLLGLVETVVDDAGKHHLRVTEHCRHYPVLSVDDVPIAVESNIDDNDQRLANVELLRDRHRVIFE